MQHTGPRTWCLSPHHACELRHRTRRCIRKRRGAELAQRDQIVFDERLTNGGRTLLHRTQPLEHRFGSRGPLALSPRQSQRLFLLRRTDGRAVERDHLRVGLRRILVAAAEGRCESNEKLQAAELARVGVATDQRCMMPCLTVLDARWTVQSAEEGYLVNMRGRLQELAPEQSPRTILARDRHTCASWKLSSTATERYVTPASLSS